MYLGRFERNPFKYTHGVHIPNHLVCILKQEIGEGELMGLWLVAVYTLLDVR